MKPVNPFIYHGSTNGDWYIGTNNIDKPVYWRPSYYFFNIGRLYFKIPRKWYSIKSWLSHFNVSWSRQKYVEPTMLMSWDIDRDRMKECEDIIKNGWRGGYRQ